MKEINRLVLYIAAGLLIGEILFINSIKIFWGFILVPVIIIINTISRKKKSACAFLCLLFLVSVCIGWRNYESKLDILKQCDAIDNGELVRVSGKVVNIWENSNGISVEIKRKNDGVKVLCYFEEFDCKIGSEILVCGENKKFDEATNCGEFDVKEYYNSKEIFQALETCSVITCSKEYSEIFNWFYVSRIELKRAILEICDTEEAGVLCAMLFGDKEYLDEEIKELYTISGIGHILAISGLHISLAGGIVYQLMRKFMRQPAAFLISSGIMLCFCGISGASVSTVRAIIMYMINVFSHVLGRKYDIKNAMSIAMIWVLFDNPLYINNGGFVLSFASVAGIAFILPIIDEVFAEYKNKKVLSALLTSSALYFSTLIIIADMYYEIPVYSILLNALLLPLMGVIVVSGFMGGVLFLVAAPIGKLVVVAAVLVLKIYKWVCLMFSNIPINTYVTGDKNVWQLVLYYFMLMVVLGLCLTMKRRKYPMKKILPILSLGIVIMLGIVLCKREYVFMVSMLDVGQGDCIYVESPNGNNYLIDGGSSDEKQIGQYKIEPFLKSRGRDKISAVFVTHTDTDHISGILELIENDLIIIENIFFSKHVPEKNEGYIKMCNLADEKNIKVHFLEAGNVISDETFEFVCISPMANVTYKDINGASIVLLGQYKEYKFLFTGDIGKDEEKTLMESEYVNLLTDLTVLKVAHHGSKNSSDDDFLSLTNPKYAVISCGRDNIYGHPASRVLTSLENVGARLCIGYECGMVWFEEKNGKLRFYYFSGII